MILVWAQSIPALFCASAIMLIPGMLLLRSLLGMRGLALVALSPVASVAMLSIAALALGLTPIAWSPFSLAVAVLAMVLVAGGVGQLLGRPGWQVGTEARRWALPLGISVGVILGAWRLIAYIQDPAGISQTNDSVFHMNAIRYVLDTADASSLHLSSVIGGTGFYPAAWHAIVSMTVLLSGAEIPIATNAVTVVLGAVVWPLGIAWMTRAVTGSTAVAAVAATLSPALQTFPLLMFQWGVLFPNALSITLIPAAAAAVMTLPTLIHPARRLVSAGRGVLLLVIVAAALALSQPAALPIWGLIGAIWFSDRMLRRRPRVVPIAAAIGMWLVLSAVWCVLAQGTGGSHWPPFRGKAEALADVLLNGHLRMPFAWVISVLMLVGVAAALHKPAWRWFVVAWLGLSALYVFVASVGMPVVRDVLLGPWYADPYRLAALAPIVVIPLAAIGTDAVVGFVAKQVRSTSGAPRSAGLAVTVAAGAMIAVTLWRPVPMPAFLQGTFDRESRYLTTSDSYLSTDERDLLESLGSYVSPSARVIANPSTGAAFGYMLSGLDVYPRTWAPPSSPEWGIIAEGLRDAAADPVVCDALERLGDPGYVLDFGEGEAGPGRFVMPGTTHFAGQPGFELVAERGEVSLWRITACDG